MSREENAYLTTKLFSQGHNNSLEQVPSGVSDNAHDKEALKDFLCPQVTPETNAWLH